jgi:hypothetical protein
MAVDLRCIAGSRNDQFGSISWCCELSMNARATRCKPAWDPRIPQLVKQRKVLRKWQVDQDLQESLARTFGQGESLVDLTKELLELGPWIEQRVLGDFNKVSDPTMHDEVRPAGRRTMTDDIGHADLDWNEGWKEWKQHDPYYIMTTPNFS